RRIPIERHADTQAAIDHEVQQPSIGAAWIERLQEHEVGPEAHLAVLVAGRSVQVDDAPVRRVRRVYREVQLAIDALVVVRERATAGSFQVRNGHTLRLRGTELSNSSATDPWSGPNREPAVFRWCARLCLSAASIWSPSGRCHHLSARVGRAS